MFADVPFGRISLPGRIALQRLLSLLTVTVVVIAAVMLSACSQNTLRPQFPGEHLPGNTPVDQSSLPSISSPSASPSSAANTAGTSSLARIDVQQLELGDLTSGQHHPAIHALFAQAEQARQQQLWRTALKYLDQARQIEPRNAAILYRQAWVQLKLGRAGQAEQLLRRAKVFAREKQLIKRLDWLLAQSLDAQGKGEAGETARQRALQN